MIASIIQNYEEGGKMQTFSQLKDACMLKHGACDKHKEMKEASKRGSINPDLKAFY